ncbi:MAG: DUF1573 domain-containing protein, partial [Planctomycetota bacterium]
MTCRTASVRAGLLVFAALCMLGGSPSLMGQEWARKMFTEASHDFRTVSRGSKAEFLFKFKNPYKETLHIASVSTSCRCTTPSVTKSSIKTYEEAA